MGHCQSKSASAAVTAATVDDYYDDVQDDLAMTFYEPTTTSRHRMAWHRQDMDISNVYEVFEIIGQGSMGEVCIVQKKPEILEMARIKRQTSSCSSIDGSGKSRDYGVFPPLPSTPRKYACKTVHTVRMIRDEVKEFINEIDILRDLDHPNIIQLFEVYSTKRKIWIVTDLCTGGDLGERARNTNMKEPDVVVVLEQILRAVSYMHKRNVCHRDIKFENIMYSDSSPDASIKLIDFGLSNKFQKGERMNRACGTVYTAAPEVLFGSGCSEKSDIWSIGVVAYILLSREYPFLTGVEELKDESKRAQLENARFVMGPGWRMRKISKFGKEFVANCLRKHPGARWTALDALDFMQTKWIPYLMEKEEKKILEEGKESIPTIQTPLGELEGNVSTSSNRSKISDSESLLDRSTLRKSVPYMRQRTRMDANMFTCMSNFALYGELKKRVLMTCAYTMDKGSLTELQEMFAVIDRDNTGTISLNELKTALKSMHSEKHIEEEVVEKLFRGMDIDNSGQIHYAEFLAAVVEGQGLITMERLADAFDRLDSDGKGYISRDDLKKILGSDYNEELVNKMLEEVDDKKDGQVDYDEFLRLMFDDDPAQGMENVAPGKNLNEDRSMVDRLGSFGPKQ